MDYKQLKKIVGLLPENVNVTIDVSADYLGSTNHGIYSELNEIIRKHPRVAIKPESCTVQGHYKMTNGEFLKLFKYIDRKKGEEEPRIDLVEAKWHVNIGESGYRVIKIIPYPGKIEIEYYGDRNANKMPKELSDLLNKIVPHSTFKAEIRV